MSENDQIARQAIAADLFGPDALQEHEQVPVPEKYELIRKLGRGGCGVVYLARDRVLERDVALKYLNEGRAGVLERFRREARFTARLDSPSIVKVYEMAEIDGQPYIAMEYVSGGNLAESPMSREELLRCIREVAKALHHAHQHGIVHRDIKPENILIDRQGRARLTDFGVARDVFDSDGKTLSQDGQIVGTPALMSPEQARGDLHAVDARSDIYSLGATLYFKLTGHWPFEGDHVVDVLHAVIHDYPRLPRSWVPSLPRGLESMVLKCMQKEQCQRYQSMAEVIEDLDRHLAGGPVLAEARAWFRKLVGREEPAVPAVEDPFHTLGLEVARDIASYDAERYRVSRNLPRLFPRLEAVGERLERFLKVRPDASWARFFSGVALFRRGRLTEALEAMEQTIDRCGRLPGAYFELGRLYLSLHQCEQQEARKHFSRVGTEEHLAEAHVRLNQAVLAFQEARRLKEELPFWQVRFPDAMALLAASDFTGCVEVCDEILAQDPDAEEVWKLRGDALHLSGGDPMKSYDEALLVRRSFYEACLAKAEVWRQRGACEKARECLRQTLDIHPNLVNGQVALARTWLEIDGQDLSAQDYLEGLGLIDLSIEQEPEHYEARVTRAELHLQRARGGREPALLDLALADLRVADELCGCGNRVYFLRVQALLERARHKTRSGEDPDSDLAEIFRFESGAACQVPDNESWLKVLAQAHALHETAR